MASASPSFLVPQSRSGQLAATSSACRSTAASRWKVTLRDRDSLDQTRLPIAGLADDLATRLAQPWQSPKPG